MCILGNGGFKFVSSTNGVVIGPACGFVNDFGGRKVY